MRTALQPRSPSRLTKPIPNSIGLANRPKTVPLIEKSSNITPEERDANIKHFLKRKQDLIELIINYSNISLYSWDDMKKLAEVEVTNSTDLEGPNTVTDPFMGPVTDSAKCQFCGEVGCPGHFGIINFRLAIYNPAFIRDVISVLKCVCNECGGLLVTEDIMQQQGFLKLMFEKRLRALELYCKDLECKKTKNNGDPCGKNPKYITKGLLEDGVIKQKTLAAGEKRRGEVDPGKVIPIDRIIKILNSISDNDARLLGFSETIDQMVNRGVSRDRARVQGLYKNSHPRDMIMYGMLVLPNIARPSEYRDGRFVHDSLTFAYLAIMRRLRRIENVNPYDKDYKKNYAKAIQSLYTAVRTIVFNKKRNKAAAPKSMGGRNLISIVDRIQGKRALMRNLLMGKIVDYCGRTVAGPNSSLQFGQIGLPQVWGPILTKRSTVTDFNYDYLTNLLNQDPPKITHITPVKSGLRRIYSRTRPYKLRIGDKVDRWLANNDRIIVNRQPTLHRQSMMGYRVVLGNHLNTGLHLSYTPPMNADFDGDEVNTWNPQDFEVEAEVEFILNVIYNMMSSEQNRPIMGLVMNSISAAYILTREDVRLNNDLFAELLNLITNQDSIQTLSARLLKYSVHPRSGRAIFSALLPADFYYNQKGVLILEGVLVSGRLKKSHCGVTHRSIIQELYKNYGPERTADFFTDATWILNKWIIEYGFSVGILDLINLAIDPKKNEEYDKNTVVLKEELAKIYVQLEALGGKLSDPIEEAFRIKQITDLANIATGIGIRLANDVLTPDNSVGIMTEKGAGTKGAVANIGQMMGAVGQQFYRGERLKATITGNRRLLPIYDIDDNDPEAHAFIPTSFFTGLTPQGLFFLQAGGRENLLDTALKTAETGSMQHRMIKAFENIIIGYDGSIRNTIGTMFLPVYNSGYDIGEMIAVDYPGKQDFSSFIDIKSVVSELNVKRGWVPEGTNSVITNKRRRLDNFAENILPATSPNYVKGPILPTENVEYEFAPAPITNINKFEKARVIGIRATQLINNDQPLIDIGDKMDPMNIDPVNIAIKEFDAGLIDMNIIRKFPDGQFEEVPANIDFLIEQGLA